MMPREESLMIRAREILVAIASDDGTQLIPSLLPGS
jgi:hypothetical protein